MTHRVMQECETGEEFCAFTGTERQCVNWIGENAYLYPESTFWHESCSTAYAYDPDYDGDEGEWDDGL